MGETSEPTDHNEIRLCGRLAGATEERELPSGDRLLIFRLTVRRPDATGPRVDSIDCVSTRARVRRVLIRAQTDDWLELTGALRRRFWRGPNGVAQSRYAVDVETARRIARTRPRPAASATGPRRRADA